MAYESWSKDEGMGAPRDRGGEGASCAMVNDVRDNRSRGAVEVLE